MTTRRLIQGSYFLLRRSIWRGLSSIFISLLVSTGAHSQVMRTTGEFLFGPDMSQNEACAAATARAKEEAIRQVYRESFSALQQDSCRESVRRVDSRECFYNSFAWSSIDGEIRSAKQIDRKIETVSGASRCIVDLEVDVARPEPPDVNFFFDVRVDPLIVRPGDALSFSVLPAGPMYLAVFGWTPDPVSGKGQVVRLFPNDFDKDPLVKTKFNLPSAQGSSQYEFKVEWDRRSKRDFIDEYLIFVATKSLISWLPEYGFDSFGAKLREIPQSNKRVLKRSYRIVNQRAP